MVGYGEELTQGAQGFATGTELRREAEGGGEGGNLKLEP